MEIERSPPEVAKKLWNIIRAVFFMLKTSISKSKIMIDLHLMFKRGNKFAGKAIGNLIVHHYSSLTCRSNDAHLSFISPREYEFSCSNSPALNFYPFHPHKRKHHRHLPKAYRYNDVTTVAAVQRVLEMLNNEAAAETAAGVAASSPLVLPGFGRSPMVRQLRVTDSPFPLKDEGDSMVDKEAEEFIKRFYKELKSQKIMAALESPCHNVWGR
ncbi:uncharacterized protein LOC110816291 [Carica papaya]|uniref:uncharacterized protein LOC110816291 n=1 Tax=Carica papaya TaxID=3649 RepID=UPI000B8C919A|nr:uncharacterized protein LOC110816291 [Carica papaya]